MAALIVLLALLVGALGTLTGSGGALLLVPLLVWLAGVPVKTAIGASLISVIATAITVGARSGHHRISHTHLSIVLEVATTLGALSGATAAVFLNPRVLQAMLGLAVAFVVVHRRGRANSRGVRVTGLLDSAYVDPVTGVTVRYGVDNLPAGLAASFLAGNLSGLLGTGGGFLKVRVMTLVMGMPPRAAVATSNFMIAVTAATSAEIFYARGYIDPSVAIPTTVGVLLGAQLGACFRRLGSGGSGGMIEGVQASIQALTRRATGCVPPRATPRPALARQVGELVVLPGVGRAAARMSGHRAHRRLLSVYVNHDVLDLVTGRRPEVARSSRVRAQAQLNRVVHLVMRLGLVAGGGLLLLGAALALALGQRLPTVDPAPLEALSRALRLEPAGLLVLGVGVLVATPIVSLAACLAVFAGRRDWRYAAIAGLVLSITLVSIAVGAS